MALQTSGQISIYDIAEEFGGGASDSLSEYYRGGAYVPDVPTNGSIPTSGTIDFADFYGAQKVPLATGGDSVYDVDVNGTLYRVHEFENDGTFSVTSDGEFEYLIVAGGGGGGSYRGAGGGAGGYVEGTLNLPTGDQSVVVGNGGAGADGGDQKGANGEDSIFNGITAIGGGGAGAYNDINGKDGGSGGGANKNGSGGAGLQPYSTDGGFGNDGLDSTTFSGRGGGGAGSTASISWPYPGGAGKISSITGVAVTYAEGGSSRIDSPTTPATYGSGGDGASSGSDLGATGQQGIVIIRYKI